MPAIAFNRWRISDARICNFCAVVMTIPFVTRPGRAN